MSSFPFPVSVAVFSRRYRTTVGIRLVVVWKNYPCPAICFGRTSFKEDYPRARDRREAWRIGKEMNDVSRQQVFPGEWEGRAEVVADGERGERLQSDHFVSEKYEEGKEKEEAACFTQKELVKANTVAQEHHRWKRRKTRGKATTPLSLSLAAAVLLALIRFGKLSEVPIPPGLFPFSPAVFSDYFSRFVVMLFLLLLLFSVNPPPPLCFSVGWTPLWVSHRHPGPQSCFLGSKPSCFPRGKRRCHRFVAGCVLSSRGPAYSGALSVQVSFRHPVKRCRKSDGLALGVPGKQFPVVLPGWEEFICRVICT